MRILLIHQYFLEENDPGGSRFNEMAQVWVDLGHEVTVLCGMLNYLTGNVPEKYSGQLKHTSAYYNGVRVIRAKVHSGYNTSFLSRLWNFFSFVYYGIRALWNHQGEFDVLIATSPPLFVGFIARVLAWRFKIPYLFEVRDLWPESAISTGVLTNGLIIKLSYWLESMSYKHANLINVLTPAFEKVLIEKKGVDKDKIIYIPNAVDFSLAESAMQEQVQHMEELRKQFDFLGVYIGAHGVANHLEQLLDAAELLAEEKVGILLIGDGMRKTELKRLANDRELNNVIFIDSVPKRLVYAYISQADVGISCLQKNDTFKTVYSNKTFDYMACKRPIIMAIDGVSRSLVEEAVAGTYVEPENAVAIAKAIINYKDNEELVVQQGSNGYAYAKNHFDRTKLAKDYVELIQQKVFDV